MRSPCDRQNPLQPVICARGAEPLRFSPVVGRQQRRPTAGTSAAQRRGWDSNPRAALRRPTVFETFTIVWHTVGLERALDARFSREAEAGPGSREYDPAPPGTQEACAFLR